MLSTMIGHEIGKSFGKLVDRIATSPWSWSLVPKGYSWRSEYEQYENGELPKQNPNAYWSKQIRFGGAKYEYDFGSYTDEWGQHTKTLTTAIIWPIYQLQGK